MATITFLKIHIFCTNAASLFWFPGSVVEALKEIVCIEKTLKLQKKS